ncbi:MAG: ABC transporter ATP-binding protein [Myxococcales bacterium]|nr:ABC transporter ATP-binding protein [Myxococcales bacterium]
MKGRLAVIGPNGSGKTTLLKTIVGSVYPDKGHILVGDRVLSDTKLRIEVPVEDRQVGYVPQDYTLFPHMNVINNVAFGLSTGGRRGSRACKKEIALRMLGRFGCQQIAYRPVQQLSGGERQQVALAQALVTEPRLLLLDEPLVALDMTSRRVVRLLLQNYLSQLDIPTVFTTHDVRDVVSLADSVIVLSRGKVVQMGTLEELQKQPCNDFLVEFLGQQ